MSSKASGRPIIALPFTGLIDEWPVASLQEAFDVLPYVDAGLSESTSRSRRAMRSALQQLLMRLAAFGIADAFPRVQDVMRPESKIG